MNVEAGTARILTEAKRVAAILHNCPEGSLAEHKTTAIIKDWCQRFNVPLLDLGLETGAVAFLDAGAARTVAFRADIDAVTLDIGIRHLCGHDYHTATLLGALAVLSEQRSELPHNVLFIFQPAEENTKGARLILESGLFDRLSPKPFRLFGIHNRPEMPVGQVGVRQGALMAEKSNFTVIFTGRGGHGGTPELCVDPIVAAAAFITGVQSIISRNASPFLPAVCSVCSIRSGSEQNYAPEVAVMTGSIRTLDHALHERIADRVRGLATDTAAAFECACEVDMVREVPAVFNSSEMTAAAREAAVATVGKANVVSPDPCLGSEDFALLGEAIPSFFYWVGSGDKSKQNAAWHSEQFEVADGYLDIAIPLLVHAALAD